ncbi:30S ribosomal protein S18 [Fimbriiglobus ruber]|uniref:Small ribosomal subunit protein bS18 n=1 Tax=Fimbriiglobus ruber TaxID=1908690 RepID=A0A225DUP9_9BACT|nr:30S ribosomal protein S18 [Fimbriiglobus ruber]OWK45061.1 SSU ribosomal protein S18p [Fimbriiglobus ruber]
MARAQKQSASGQKLVRAKSRRGFNGVPKGYEPRPAFFDYKDVSMLKKFITSHGKLMSRRRTGLSATAQKALARAVKRARFMALLPYTAE